MSNALDALKKTLYDLETVFSAMEAALGGAIGEEGPEREAFLRIMIRNGREAADAAMEHAEHLSAPSPVAAAGALT